MEKVVQKLCPSFPKVQVPALYSEALERSRSDIEISPSALVSIVSQHRLLHRVGFHDEDHCVSLDVRMPPPRLDAQMVAFALEGLRAWALADAPELVGGDSAETTADAAEPCSPRTIEGRWGTMQGHNKGHKPFIGYLLQQAGQLVAKVEQQGELEQIDEDFRAKVGNAWGILEQIARHLIVELQKRHHSAISGTGATLTTPPSVSETRAKIEDSASLLHTRLISLLAEARDSQHAIGDLRRERLQELEKKIEEVAAYAQAMLRQDPAVLS